MLTIFRVEHSERNSLWRRLGHWWGMLSTLFWSVELHLPKQSKDQTGRAQQAQADLTEMSDERLVQWCLRVQAKDDRPFREIFRRHRATVWGVCYGFVRNAEDAEDLMQDVFFRAYRSLAQFEGRSSLKTWLYRIATNVSQNELRRRSRRPQESETAIEDFNKPLAMGDTPETHVLAQAQREKLSQALASLRPDAYEAIKLKDLEERPYAEIARQLNISQSAAKMRVQRARLALMTAFRQMGD